MIKKHAEFCLLILFTPVFFMPGVPELTAQPGFLYQLQNLDIEAVASTGFDLVIMDYSAEGDDETAFTAGEINTLKNSSWAGKSVLAYLSIGEAEDYRFYWESSWKPGNPGWLLQENPEWEGNFKVEFWDLAWRNIIFSYIDRILAAGFDGVYLDLIDAYEGFMPVSSIEASQLMVDFVKAIREYIRPADNGFLIYVQNAPELATMHPEYLNAVDGIGQEDIYYGYDGDGVRTPDEVTQEMEQNLDVFLNAGKTVLTVDYPFASSETEPHFDSATMLKVVDAYTRSRSKGYIPYCTVRELGYLTLNPGFIPVSVQAVPGVQQYRLYPSFPNPFNMSSMIQYDLPGPCHVRAVVLDITGRERRVLEDSEQSGGTHWLEWNAAGMASGSYIIQLDAGTARLTSRTTLIK
ncbi:endo alpha-1,4 polygalactosaminidase [bacterium]|nr:endo alpha-1,4 polygalactosaminidase [bacterium]